MKQVIKNENTDKQNIHITTNNTINQANNILPIDKPSNKRFTKAAEVATIISTIVAIIALVISFTDNSIKSSIIASFSENGDSNISFEEQPEGVIENSFNDNQNTTINFGKRSKR